MPRAQRAAISHRQTRASPVWFRALEPQQRATTSRLSTCSWAEAVRSTPRQLLVQDRLKAMAAMGHPLPCRGSISMVRMHHEAGSAAWHKDRRGFVALSGAACPGRSGTPATTLPRIPSMTTARAFRGFRFPAEVILWAVRWYLQFPISYRDLEAMLADRGVAAPCCMDRRCGRIEPYPCSGSCGADVLRASEVQHPVQNVGGDGYLGHLSPVSQEA